MSGESSTSTSKPNLKLPFMPISEEIEQDSAIFGQEVHLNREKDARMLEKQRKSKMGLKFKLPVSKKKSPTFVPIGKKPSEQVMDNFTPKTDATMDPDSCKRLNKAAKKMKKKVNLRSGFKIKKRKKAKKGTKVAITEPEQVTDEHIFLNNIDKGFKVAQPKTAPAPRANLIEAKTVTPQLVEAKEAPKEELKQEEILTEEEKRRQADVELKKFYSLKFEQKMELIRKLDKEIVRHFFEKDYEGKILASFERKLKEDVHFLRKFKLPLVVNAKGKLEYMSGYSYHNLLSLKEFGNACRDCQVNALDATKDKRRKITKKIWSRLRHIYFLNRPSPDPNLRFNQEADHPEEGRAQIRPEIVGRPYGYF